MKNMENQAQNIQSRNARAASGQIYFFPEEMPAVRTLLAQGCFFSVVKPLTGEAAERFNKFEAIGKRERA